MTSKFYSSIANGLKLKVRTFWVFIPTFLEVTEKNLVVGFALYCICYFISKWCYLFYYIPSLWFQLNHFPKKVNFTQDVSLAKHRGKSSLLVCSVLNIFQNSKKNIHDGVFCSKALGPQFTSLNWMYSINIVS